MRYDAIVVGLGAMGSAALCQLARRKLRVLGIERFEPGHERGSSHGRTRIIRQGYFEHPSYVPLVQRAYSLWRELERASGRKLLTVTGIAEIGRPDGMLVQGTLAASREHELPHQVFTASEFMRLYPAFRLPQDYVAVLQPDGGFVEAEAGIRAHLQLAAAAGAGIHTGERVLVNRGCRTLCARAHGAPHSRSVACDRHRRAMDHVAAAGIAASAASHPASIALGETVAAGIVPHRMVSGLHDREP